MKALALIAFYILLSCSCEETKCDAKSDDVLEALEALPVDCEVDVDCQTSDTDTCYCTRGIRADADLTDLTEAREALGECLDPNYCANNLDCPYEPLEPACIEGRCKAVPAYECEDLGELLSNVRFCTADEECEVRSDITPCGCPTAVSVGLDEPRGTGSGSQVLGRGVLMQRLVEKCDYTEMCALVDCAVGESARCNEDNECELAP